MSVNHKTSSLGRNERFAGAWMTDIDDTIIPSGVSPDQQWINWLTDHLRVLKEHNIVWVPMTGVAIDKLAPRILSRLPDDVRSHIIYYGGDGSQKYTSASSGDKWEEDLNYRRVFSDAQALAIMGDRGFIEAQSCNAESAERRRDEARRKLIDGGFDSEKGILGEMTEILKRHGFDGEQPETYFRGGSISWMMLGDVSVQPYQTDEAEATRAELLEYGKARLHGEDHLERFGSEAIHIPFHGSRGIKFVLKDNDKERGTRDLMVCEQLDPDSILFVGNELFSGGNDHVITNVPGITMISVGERTDPGPRIVYGGEGIEANNSWMTSICAALERGEQWQEIIAGIRSHEFELT